MSETAVRACVECKHFKGAENVYHAQMQKIHSEPECGHPSANSRDMIYGKALCANERNDKKGCGKQGKLWESRNSAKSA